MQPELGQKDMLETMLRQFAGGEGAPDLTESFVLAVRALLAAQRSILERRVTLLEPAFPFALS